MSKLFLTNHIFSRDSTNVWRGEFYNPATNKRFFFRASGRCPGLFLAMVLPKYIDLVHSVNVSEFLHCSKRSLYRIFNKRVPLYHSYIELRAAIEELVPNEEEF